MTQHDFVEEEWAEEEVEPRSRLKRFVYTLFVVSFILILLITTTGLGSWLAVGRLALINLTGETEAAIVERLGQPEFRSGVHTFVPGEGFGMVPKRLDEGDEFYFLNYVIGPRLVVFHFVSPETYTKHTGQLVLGDAWVVLEYYSGSRYVIY